MTLSRALKEPWWALRRARLRRHERQGDRALGVDTYLGQFNTKLDPNAKNNPNEPTHYSALAIIAEEMALGGEDVFFDLGCGKGRVVCFFAQQPLRQVIGVEYDTDLAALASANAERMTGRVAPISIIRGDAGEQDYSTATAVFMFNPFGAEVVRRVMQRLDGRRGVRVAYMGPAHSAIVGEFPAFQVEKRFKVPYDLGHADVVVWRHA